MIKNFTEKGSRKYAVSFFLLIAVVIVGVSAVFQVYTKGYVSLCGYSMFRVVTGSMEPEISTGALLICKAADIEEIAEDDIVCYVTDVTEIKGSVVTHRVVAVKEDDEGQLYLVTKGDANLVTDSYYVTSENLVGRAVWYSGQVNFMTDFLSFLSSSIGFIACIVLPLVFICAVVMRRSVKSLKNAVAEVAKETVQQKKENTPAEGYETITAAEYERMKAEIEEQLKKEQEERQKKMAEGYKYITAAEYEKMKAEIEERIRKEQENG